MIYIVTKKNSVIYKVMYTKKIRLIKSVLINSS